MYKLYKSIQNYKYLFNLFFVALIFTHFIIWSYHFTERTKKGTDALEFIEKIHNENVTLKIELKRKFNELYQQ